MPYKEREISKKYHTIGEVAEKLEVNTSLIRFWESEFEILNPKKNKKGLRKYTEKDIQILEKIYHLLKKEGFTIDGAKKAFKRKKEINSESFQSQLENIKNKLIEIMKKIYSKPNIFFIPFSSDPSPQNHQMFFLLLQ